MDPQVDQFFDAAKYPEFEGWSPVMTDIQGDSYVSGSVVNSDLFHETSSLKAKAIYEEGVDVTKSTPTVYFAAGHYMAAERSYAKDRFGTIMLTQKVLIKQPFQVKDHREFLQWQDAEGISGYPEKYRPRMSTFLLLSKGHDGLRILEDTPGVPASESWLAFHPKQVVTLSRDEK